MGFGNKSNSPFRNIPENGMNPNPAQPRILNATKHDSRTKGEKENKYPFGSYKWRKDFNLYTVGTKLNVKIREYHEFAIRNPQFAEKNVIAKIWDINVKDKIIWLTIEGYVGTIKVNYHLMVIFNDTLTSYLTHNGVHIKGKHKEKMI